MTRRSTLVIAEAGVNHNGDQAMAEALIDAAAVAGADYVKFQTFSADRLATKSAPTAAYQQTTTGGGVSQHAMLSTLELTTGTYGELVTHADSRGIGLFSTGFDTASIDSLVAISLPLVKVPSGEVTNLPYLRHVGTLDRDIIVSTGMCDLGEIEAALAALERAGTPRNRVTVLHCTTAYPAPLEDVNLRAMTTIRDVLDVRVGYSDHTSGIDVAIAAVALGARVIEKHLTLDRALPGPDHAASLEPHEFAAMVRCIRNVEVALGDGCKTPKPSELANMAVARKSIVAATDIRTGEVFTSENLTTKRPGTGISPMRWDDVLGRRARRDFAADELIET